MADGEILPFAVVDELYGNQDGTYEVFFYEIFDFTNSFGADPYATLPEDLYKKINVNDNIRLGRRIKAIITRHNFEGTNRYKLLSYTTVE